jgi:hypothetical protein
MYISGEIPSGVDEVWYQTQFLNPTINSICSFPIIKTASGHKLTIPQVIIPEVTYLNKMVKGM